MNLKLVTEYDIGQCKKILHQKVNQSYIFGDLKIIFKNNSLTVFKRNNSFTNIFEGSFLTEGTNTILVGTFATNKMAYNFLIVLKAIFICAFAYEIILIFKQQDVFKNTLNAFFFAALFFSVVSIQRYGEKSGIEDQNYIIDKLKTLLNAVEDTN